MSNLSVFDYVDAGFIHTQTPMYIGQPNLIRNNELITKLVTYTLYDYGDIGLHFVPLPHNKAEDIWDSETLFEEDVIYISAIINRFLIKYRNIIDAYPATEGGHFDNAPKNIRHSESDITGTTKGANEDTPINSAVGDTFVISNPANKTQGETHSEGEHDADETLVRDIGYWQNHVANFPEVCEIVTKAVDMLIEEKTRIW